MFRPNCHHHVADAMLPNLTAIKQPCCYFALFNFNLNVLICISTVKVKVKVTLVQALRLCTGCTAHRGRRGIAIPFLDHGTRRGWGVSVTPRPLFTPGKDPVPVVQEAGWAPGPVWTGAENLTTTGIRSSETVNPVASRYTNYSIRPTLCQKTEG